MNSLTRITILSTLVTLVYTQALFDAATNTFTCPPNPGPLAYCAGKSLTTNIIIRCRGPVGQPGNCDDNLAGIPPVGVKSFAPCYQSSPSIGDAACSYDGIAYPDNGSPFRIVPNGNTSTSSFVPFSTSNASTPIPGTQATSIASVLSTSTASVLSTSDVSNVSTSQNVVVPVQNISYQFGLTTYKAGIKITIPATQTYLSPVDVVTPTIGLYVHSGVVDLGPSRESTFNHIFTPVSVSPSAQSPVSYSSEENPTAPVVVTIEHDNHYPVLKRKGLSGLLKRSNTTAVLGKTGGTAAGTEGPVQTESPIPPVSAGSTVKGAGAWVIGLSTLALTAVMV